VLIYTLGDSLDVVKQFPDDCIDLVLTSVPYERKVRYIDPDDPLAALEIGHEETPGEYVQKLLDLTDEWARVLKDTGSIAIDIGDSSAGSGGAGGDYSDDGKKSGRFKYEGTAAAARRRPGSWPLDKSLCMIPEAYRMSLAYGRNVLTGQPIENQWIVRNVVRLCSVNPPRGRMADKYTPAVTEVVVATLSRDRFFDESHANPSRYVKDGVSSHRAMDWWVIKQQGIKGHPAVWPENTIQGFITALCPRSGVVLDPFAGSGLTLAAAGDYGRHAVGIELYPEFLPVAVDQVGMYLENREPREAAEWLSHNRLVFQSAG